MAFTIDRGGIVPLQQCVEIAKETSHRVTIWHRDPESLLQEEGGVVSKIFETQKAITTLNGFHLKTWGIKNTELVWI